MKKHYFGWALGFLAAWVLASPGRARAYLDPGTGSYLFQILIAGLIGGLFAIKIFWVKIKGFFLGLFGKRAEGAAGEEGDVSAGQPE